MKARKIISFLFLFIITQSLYSQSGWFWQNPLPQGNNLNDIHLVDANTGYSYSWDNILKTTDCGESWQLLYTGFATNNSSLSMTDANTGYILLDTTKLIKTTNGGNNWIFVSNLTGVNVPSWLPPNLHFTSQYTGYIFSLTDTYYMRGTKLQRTSNGGLNWDTQISDTGFTLGVMDFPTAQTGYIAGSKNLWYGNYYHFKIFKTTNGGNNWDSIPNTINLKLYSIYFVDEYTGFAGGQPSTGSAKVLKTTNGGTNWIQNDFNFQGGVRNIYFVNQNVGYVVSGSFWIYRTTNGGVNWVSIDVQPIAGQNYLQDVSFADANTGLGIGTGGLIMKTTNGGINWIKKTRGTDIWFWDVKFSDVNTGFTCGDYGTLLRTTNGGSNWDLIQFSRDDDIGPVAPVNSNLWYVASSPDGKIFKTTNTGFSWDTLYTGLYAISRLEFLNQNTGMGVCKYNSFFKTTNGGLNWLIYNNLNYSQNWVMDFIDENTGYAGDKIAKTTNGGLNWDTLSFGMDFYANDVQFLNYNTGYICGVTNTGYYTGYVMKTTNAGVNWTPKVVSTTGPIEDLYFVNENTGYCTGWEGVFKTIDGSQNWYQIRTCSQGTPDVIFFPDSLIGYMVGAAGNIIKTTNGGGEPIGIQPIGTEIPNQFTLFQNYPNPFNPVTKIKFQIPAVGQRHAFDTRLVIYNLLGREVATLINEQLSPGTYEVQWNAADFASGVYFYQLSINNELFATKKMVLIK